jgi:hypothetical protein
MPVTPKAAADPTRRRFTRALTLGAGLLTLGAVTVAARAASAKLAPADVGYRPVTNTQARCDHCVNWVAPNACRLVTGPISPSGWCGLYARMP